MGDYWQHEVRIEKRMAIDKRKRYPACTGGSGTCPPEDCGGFEAYLYKRDEATGFDAIQDLIVNGCMASFNKYCLVEIVIQITHICLLYIH